MSRLHLNNLSFEKLGQFSIFDQANSIADHTKKGTGLAGAVEGDARRSSVCGNVRGIGLIIGVEFVADMKTRGPFAASSYPHRIVANYAFELAYSIFLAVNSSSPLMRLRRGLIAMPTPSPRLAEIAGTRPIMC